MVVISGQSYSYVHLYTCVDSWLTYMLIEPVTNTIVIIEVNIQVLNLFALCSLSRSVFPSDLGVYIILEVLNHKMTQNNPATSLPFIGIILDSSKMEAHLPPDKLMHIWEELTS